MAPNESRHSPQPGLRVRREECAPGSRRPLLGLHLVKRQTSHRRLAALAVEADQAVLHVRARRAGTRASRCVPATDNGNEEMSHRSQRQPRQRLQKSTLLG